LGHSLRCAFGAARAAFSVDQPHPEFGLVSPDGLTKIVLGDPSAIAYGGLTTQMRSLGFREGQSYTPHGEPEIVQSYPAGEQWSWRSQATC
jgi:hypothetical protein